MGPAQPRGSPRVLHAKVETADTKPSFRRAWKDQHCVVPVSGWFEWKTLGGLKQPFYFHRPANAPLFLGGLWDGRNFTLLTMGADGLLADYRHRRPIGLDARAAQAWLDGKIHDRETLLNQVIPSERFALHAVSRRMNRSGVDGPHLIDSVEVASSVEQQSLL